MQPLGLHGLNCQQHGAGGLQHGFGGHGCGHGFGGHGFGQGFGHGFTHGFARGLGHGFGQSFRQPAARFLSSRAFPDTATRLIAKIVNSFLNISLPQH